MHSMLIPDEVKRPGIMAWLADQLGEHRVTTSLKWHGKIKSDQAWCERVAEGPKMEISAEEAESIRQSSQGCE